MTHENSSNSRSKVDEELNRRADAWHSAVPHRGEAREIAVRVYFSFGVVLRFQRCDGAGL